MELTNEDITILLSVLDAWMQRQDAAYMASTDEAETAKTIEAMSRMQVIIDKLEAKFE